MGVSALERPVIHFKLSARCVQLLIGVSSPKDVFRSEAIDFGPATPAGPCRMCGRS